MIVSINYKNQELKYVYEELKLFLEKYTNCEILENNGNSDKKINLVLDESIPSHHYMISGNGSTLEIKAENKSSLLCGVYEVLADSGILFEATGYSLPKYFDLNKLFKVNKIVKPKFRLRGIRQHINFPMDVSSFALREAKEYIRNLARMRYNSITFHSYPGQWHETKVDDPTDFAGHFFYGHIYKVPTDEPLTAKRVDNRKYYCIPEAEAIFEDKAKRAEYAKYWLNEMMETAKEAGMTITLSLEVTYDDEVAMVKMLNKVLKTYPLIDTFEIISEECGGERETPGLTRENAVEFLKNLFGENIVDENGEVPSMPSFLPHQLGCSAISLKRVLRAIELKDLWLIDIENAPELRAGIYMTCPDTLRILRPILRNSIPSDVTMSLLPAHGSLAVTDNILKTGTISSDWQNTMFYSWAEFDGNMYIQQLGTDGLHRLTEIVEGDSAYGFAINHWRTSENNLCISFAAENSISGISTLDFYRNYAEKVGIDDVELFINTSDKLAKLDIYCRDNLFNIGFCAVTCWLNWCRRGEVIMPRCLPLDKQLHAIEEYKELSDKYSQMLVNATTKESIAYLRLMINRCDTSILHIKSLIELDKVADIFDYVTQTPLDEEKLDKATQIVNKSRDYAMQYLHLYGEMLPDRGCEGQLVSYYATTLVFIDSVGANFNKNISVSIIEEYDAPPMPDAEVK